TRSLVADLARIDPRDLNPTAIAVMHTATIFQLGALAQWFGGLPEVRRPRIFIQFQFPPELGMVSGTNRRHTQTVARDAAATLVAAGTVRFASNSRSLVDQWTDQLGQRCILMPIPVRWPDDAQIHTPPERLTFGFFGG